MKLHVKYAKLSTPESGTPNASHSVLAVDDGTDSELPTEKNISKAATYAQLFYSPTFPLDAFKYPKPIFAHDSPLRYANSDEMVSKPSLGFTADIYHAFVEKYQTYIGMTSVSKEVSI